MTTREATKQVLESMPCGKFTLDQLTAAVLRRLSEFGIHPCQTTIARSMRRLRQDGAVTNIRCTRKGSSVYVKEAN